MNRTHDLYFIIFPVNEPLLLYDTKQAVNIIKAFKLKEEEMFTHFLYNIPLGLK